VVNRVGGRLLPSAAAIVDLGYDRALRIVSDQEDASLAHA
jgi:hypothetical protein